MRKLILIAAGVLLLSAQAAPNPVIQHYRAYSAALQAGDMETAETEAAAALQASVARDGNGGRTAVLALNLAKLRIARIRPQDAYEPAKLAFDIATANSSAGVDPLIARLVLGQSELSVAHEAEGHDRLLAALPEAAQRPEAQQDAYQAAVALGHWMLMRSNYADAATAWGFAAQYAPSLGDNHQIPKAEAQVNQGMALINDAAENHDRRPEYEHAAAVLAEPIRDLAPLANQAETEGLTVSQGTYARARAWRSLMNARMASLQRLNVQTPGAQTQTQDDDPWADPPPQCRLSVHIPELRQPDRVTSIGAVMVRVLLQHGQVQRLDVAASVPMGSWFEQEIRRTSPQWSVTVNPASQDACNDVRVQWISLILRL